MQETGQHSRWRATQLWNHLSGMTPESHIHMEDCTTQKRFVSEQRRIVQDVAHRQQRSMTQISAQQILHNAPRCVTIDFGDCATKSHNANGQSLCWKDRVAKGGV